MIAKHKDTMTLPGEPDADAPLTDDDFRRGYTAILARRARAEPGLSQQAFAER